VKPQNPKTNFFNLRQYLLIHSVSGSFSYKAILWLAKDVVND